MPRNKTAATRMQSLGWKLTETGGNCTAWIRKHRSGKVETVVMSGAHTAPTRRTDAVDWTLCDADDDVLRQELRVSMDVVLDNGCLPVED